MKLWQVWVCMVLWVLMIVGIVFGSYIARINHDELIRQQTVQEVCK